MSRYRVWFLGIALCVALMLAGPAAAWEFTMDGTYTWEYDYRGQFGSAGFFGPYDVDNGALLAGGFTTPGDPPGAASFTPAAGFYAPVNGWFGNLPGNFVSGSDASWQVMYMNTNMDLRVNPALRIRGTYYIGEWAPVTALNPLADFSSSAPLGNDNGLGNLPASQYLNNRFPGVQRSFSPGYWNTLWLTSQLPWGTFTIGKRPSAFGTGLFWNGEESRSSESTALIADFGPLRIQVSFHPARRATTGNLFFPFGATVASNTNATAFENNSRTGNRGYYNQDFDKNNGRDWDIVLPGITYRSGNIDVGVLANYVRSHVGGEGILDEPLVRRQAAFSDTDEWYGGTYIKYNNGRFFFNSELDTFQRTTRNRRKTAGGAPAAGVRDTYIECWRWMAEGGVLAGPTKMSAIYAWLSGPDRRAGQQIDRTGLIAAAGRRPASFSNTGLFRPYSLLMVYSYGLGAFINADSQNGYVDDANVYGARLDYAVAANLNTYATFFWADRTSQSGYGWGFIKPINSFQSGTGAARGDGALGLTHDNNRLFAPSIPDTNLGWEVDAGFDWKLLEGLIVNATFAYWMPGNWFKYACVDKSVPGWGTPAPVGAIQPVNNPVTWGINPSRGIDPVWGLEFRINSTF